MSYLWSVIEVFITFKVKGVPHDIENDGTQEQSRDDTNGQNYGAKMYTNFFQVKKVLHFLLV